MAFESGQYQAELAGAHASRSGLSKFFSDISYKHNIEFKQFGLYDILSTGV